MAADKYRIKKCSRDEYPAFLKELEYAFKNGENWFTENMPHVLPMADMATDEDICKNLIALDGERIIGALGVYPMDWVVSDGEDSVTLKISGVGQVSCHPDYRNQGIMSALIKAGLSEMEENGSDASWLHGDRFRYKNFGWELAGSKMIYSFRKWRMTGTHSGYTPRKAEVADIPVLNRIYEELKSYVLRDEKMWERHIKRRNAGIHICTSGDNAGYIAYYNDNPKVLLEACGDPACVWALMMEHMERNTLEGLEVFYPCATDELGLFLYEKSSYYKINPLCNTTVISTDRLYDKLKPFITKQIEQHNKNIFLTDIQDDESKKRICLQLLGYAFNPDIQKEYEFIKPLIFWLPELDEI